MWPFKKRGSDQPERRPLDPDPASLPPHRGSSWSELWDQWVPDVGVAPTVAGEVLRSATRVASEYSRNGCANWGPDYAEMCEYARRHLTDGTFVPRWTSFVDTTLKDMAALGDWYARRDALDEDDPDFEAKLEAMEEEGPGVDVDFESMDRVEQLTELWVVAHLAGHGGESPPRGGSSDRPTGE